MNRISLLTILLLSVMLMSSWASNGAQDYVEDACSVTHYHDLCIQSLSSFSSVAKRNPSRWARAGVSVTIAETRRVAQYLTTLQGRNQKQKGKTRGPISDCIELFDDASYNLHRSLYVLRELSVGEFDSQMEDVTTWVSAALTDEDTCIGGFSDSNGGHRIINRVSNVTYLTSNALALVNRLATAGPDCLIEV